MIQNVRTMIQKFCPKPIKEQSFLMLAKFDIHLTAKKSLVEAKAHLFLNLAKSSSMKSNLNNKDRIQSKHSYSSGSLSSMCTMNSKSKE